MTSAHSSINLFNRYSSMFMLKHLLLRNWPNENRFAEFDGVGDHVERPDAPPIPYSNRSVTLFCHSFIAHRPRSSPVRIPIRHVRCDHDFAASREQLGLAVHVPRAP